MIKTLNGRNSSLDSISVHPAFTCLEYDPHKHDFSHYLRALNSFRSEIHKLGARERRITDDGILEKAKNTLIRAFELGNYCMVDNDSFNNLLYDLVQDLIKAKTIVGFAGRHISSFASSLGSPPTSNFSHNRPT